MFQRPLQITVLPAIGKRIRRHIQDAHHLPATAEVDFCKSGSPNHHKSAGSGGLHSPPDIPSLPVMHTLATWKNRALLAILLLAAPFATAQQEPKEFEAVDGPNVRVMRHEDGSRTMFTRTPDNRTLTKKKFSANGVLMMLTIYRMDSAANPIGCRILDGQNQLIFKVSYGYRKSDGQLVEERMFDARVTRRDPNTGKEMPIQRICYVYDAQGNRSAPIVYNLLPGKTFEQVFGVKSSALETNPFQDGAPANPNAKPVGR